MSMTLPTLLSPNASLKITPISHFRLKSHVQAIPFRSLPTKPPSFGPLPSQNFHGFYGKRQGFVFEKKLDFKVCASAGNGGVGTEGDEEAKKEARGESTMPERFRYLTKEAPDPPLRWPWFVGKFLLFRLLSFFLNWVLFSFVRVLFNNKKEKENLGLIQILILG